MIFDFTIMPNDLLPSHSSLEHVLVEKEFPNTFDNKFIYHSNQTMKKYIKAQTLFEGQWTWYTGMQVKYIEIGYAR